MRSTALIPLVGVFFPFATLAQSFDVPLRNWTVPPYTLASAGGGLTSMTDVTPPRVFVGVQPCRVADTRGNGFTGQAGPPALNTGPRTFQVAGTVAGVPAPCGIPAGAEAVSFQFTIVFPNTAGNLIAWPGGAAPTISVLNWSAAETALGNGTIVPLSAGGTITVQINAAVGNATGHLVLDVNGYFSDTLGDPANSLILVHSGNSPAMTINNQATACSATCGLRVVTQSESYHDAILGHAQSATAAGTGVYGVTYGSGTGATGVRGYATSSTGVTFGVAGQAQSDNARSSAVHGVEGLDLLSLPTLQPSGVRGHSANRIGVIGLSKNVGVAGVLTNDAGASVAQGYLGYNTGPGYGVWAASNAGGTGAKFFVEPHPTDPSKVIRYISLEGNEPGTYFRGRGKFERGVARIVVPEDFRLVTDGEGLSVQITPIGAMASVAVLRADLNEIVVQASRNVEFYYLVNGVRRTHKDLVEPIAAGDEFRPASADATLPAYLTERQKELLIRNGTYNADGTVNMETARRLEWDRKWEAKPAPARERTP